MEPSGGEADDRAGLCLAARLRARALTQNPIDLDATARLFESGVSRSEKPLLAWWDIRIAVEALQLPRSFLKFLAAIYDGNEALSSGSDGLVFFYWILTGVLQGCPLSGLISVWNVDPFLPSVHGVEDRAHSSRWRVPTTLERPSGASKT